MSRFSIAGLQSELFAQDNIDVIQKEVEAVKATFPWVDMVVLSELSTFGPNPSRAQPTGGDVK